MFDVFGDALVFCALLALLVSIILSILDRLLGAKELLWVMLSVSIFCIFPLLNSIYYLDRAPLGVFVAALLCSFFAAILNSKKAYRNWILLIPFCLYTLYIVYRLSLNLNPNEVFINSKNWISYFGVLLVFPYYYRKIICAERISFLPVLVLAVLSLYSISRSGIMASFLMFYACVLYDVRSKLVKAAFPVFVVVFLGILFVATKDYLFLVELSAESRFSASGFFKDARSMIFEEYWQNLDIETFLVGFEGRELFFHSIKSANPHNSFLNALIGAGGFYFLVVLFFLLLATLMFYGSMPILLLLAACLMRVLTDAGSFLGFFDFFLFVGLFYSHTQGKRVASVKLDRYSYCRV